MLVISVCANGAVALITLVLVLIWRGTISCFLKPRSAISVGSARLYRAGGIFHGSVPGYIKYFQVMVPYAGRAGVSLDYECLVSGGFLQVWSAHLSPIHSLYKEVNLVKKSMPKGLLWFTALCEGSACRLVVTVLLFFPARPLLPPLPRVMCRPRWIQREKRLWRKCVIWFCARSLSQNIPGTSLT